MADMVRVETVLDSWKSIRDDTAQAVEEFPSDAFDFWPTDGLMTFGEIARHILEAGHALTGMMLAGVEDFTVPGFREMLNEHLPALPEGPDGAQLALALRTELDARISDLSKQPEAFFSHMMTRFDGMRVTRFEMLQFVKEHELTHRAQIFLYMRLKGLVPPTTRRRQAKK